MTAAGLAAEPLARREIAPVLGFEEDAVGAAPARWTAAAPETVAVSADAAQEGRRSVRIARTPASSGTASTLSLAIPTDFAGETLEWRGFLKTENAGARALIWLRQDGDVTNVASATSGESGPAGTTGWTEYAVTLRLSSNARTVTAGIELPGTGTLWADGFRLLVDGQPVSAAVDRPRTIIDDDREFDGGSRIALTSLSPVQIANLAKLAKVWGFLKYHHPAITGGQKHWDYELFRILPRVLSAADSGAGNQVLAAWFAALPAVPNCTRCATIDPTLQHLAANLGWLADEALLGRELSQALTRVYRNRPIAARGFYISQAAGVGTPVFENESGYASIALPDAGYQMLALFRYWNMIEYFYPYRDLMSGNAAQIQTYWDGVLRESIGPIALASTALAYRQEMLRFMARVNDSNSNLWNALTARPPRGDCLIPAEFRFVQDRLAVVRLLPEAEGRGFDLLPGDTIEELDGVPVSELVTRYRAYYPASNEAGRLRDLAANITRGACRAATVAILRAGERLRPALERVSVAAGPPLAHDLPGDAFQKLSDQVAYLKLSSAEIARVAEYVQAAEGTQALIIDLRNTPGQFLARQMGALLVPQTVAFGRWIVMGVTDPGRFQWTLPQFVSPSEPRYSGRVVLLVDELTQAQGEFSAMVFQTVPGALILGSTTAGTNGDLSTVFLPGGLRSAISGNGLYYGDKRQVQRIGILPDVTVQPTLEGLAAGRDEVLDEALRRIEAAGPLVRPDPAVIQFVPIPAGEFTMGCSPGDTDCAVHVVGGDGRQHPGEFPAHRVRIGRGFDLGKYEVTQAQWAAVMGEFAGVTFKGPTLPVDNVSYDQIQEFLRRLNERNDGFHYRLPSEAEWEYAARAGSTGRYAGSTADDAAWFNGNSQAGPPQPPFGHRHYNFYPVGQKKPNLWGLYDMLGNVGERCMDLQRRYDAAGTSLYGVSGLSATRGGDSGLGARDVRVSSRHGHPLQGFMSVGFRVLREPAGAAAPAAAIAEFRIAPATSARAYSVTLSLDSPAPPGGAMFEFKAATTYGFPNYAFVPPGQSAVAISNVAFGASAVVVDTVAARLVGGATRTASLVVSPPPGPALGAAGIEFVPVDAGEFIMGTSQYGPPHLVRLTKPVEMGRFEVTQAQWQSVMGDNPSALKDPALPVEQVSWLDVQTFLTALNARNDGYRYRLPTEAEWEWVVTSGAGPQGSFDSGGTLGWYRENSGGRTRPPGLKSPNNWGLFDLFGNVAEWVQDWFGNYSGSPDGPAAVDPTGPATGTQRGVRGSSFSAERLAAGNANRASAAPTTRSPSIGFRCVRERVDGRTSPASLSQILLEATTVPAGESFSGRVTLTAPAPGGGMSVALESADAGVVSVPASVTVPEGYVDARFALTLPPSAATGRQARITARLNADVRTATLTVAPQRNPVAGPLGIRFVPVYPGEFARGCSTGDANCHYTEPLRHLVRLTKAFEIAQFEITQAQWQTVMGGNPSSEIGADLPVDRVSWDDIQVFLSGLNSLRDGYRYRLPIDAEWEYAARAGADDKYAGGSLAEIAWYGANSQGKLQPVGTKRPNAWGLHDVLGNVVEWVQADSGWPYPAAVENADFQRARGCHANCAEPRVSASFSGRPTVRVALNGFRCVRERIAP